MPHGQEEIDRRDGEQEAAGSGRSALIVQVASARASAQYG
jgi:hypothetical protein